MKKAIILGGHGQIGSYLVDFFMSGGCKENYDVWVLGHKDFDVATAVDKDYISLLEMFKPDEIYNFASLMYAPDSWHRPMQYMKVNGLAVLQLLDTVAAYRPQTKVFQAGSAEMFEKASVIQSEDTNRLPENPYGLSKMMACEAVRIYREHYKVFACTGIFFNAESPRRKETFFARKVAMEAVRIARELAEKRNFTPIKLGKLEARRDWGWAPEYAEVAWRILQQEEPRDYCIGTGESFTCREFVLECLRAAGLPKPEEDFDKYVQYEKVGEYTRRDTMRARTDKAKRFLGWQAKYKMQDVARMLVEAEMRRNAEFVASL